MDRSKETKTGYELSVFQKNKIFENTVIFSVVLCFVIWLASPSELELGVVIAMIWPLSFLFYIVHRTVGYQYYRERNEYIECKFVGSLDELVSNLQKVGVELKDKIGNQYVFQTCNYLFFNSRVVARDDDKCCALLLTRNSYDYLKDFLSIKLLKEEGAR